MIENNENHNQMFHWWVRTPVFCVVNTVCCADQILNLRSLRMWGLKYLLNKQYKVEQKKQGEGNNNAYYYID